MLVTFPYTLILGYLMLEVTVVSILVLVVAVVWVLVVIGHAGGWIVS